MHNRYQPVSTFYSLRTRLMIIFSLTTLVPLGFMAYWFFQNSSTLARDLASDSLNTSAVLARKELDGFIDNNQRSIWAQAQLQDFSHYLTLPPDERRIFEPKISGIVKAWRLSTPTYIEYFFVLDADGRMVYNNAGLGIGRDNSQFEFYLLPMADGLPHVFLKSGSEADSRLYFSAPIYDSDGKILGVLGLRYYLAVLQNLIVQYNDVGGNGSFAMITDAQNRCLAFGKNADLVGQALNELPSVKSTGGTNNKGETFGTTLNGVSYIAAVSSLERMPWQIYFVQVADVFLIPVRSRTNFILVLIASIGALALGASLVVGYVTAEPIKYLTDIAQQIASGNLDIRAQVKSRDEIGILAQAFNEMTSNLQVRLEEINRLNERLEHRVAERTAQLTAANKELEAFSYSISHDLRAPLRAIDGFANILAEDQADRLDDQGKKALSRIQGGSKRMGELIDALLSFSRIGRQPMRCHIVQPNAIVEEVLEELAGEIGNRKIEFSINDLPPCNADPILLRQVFTNLISNALKYSRHSDPARIEVGWSNDKAAYFIRDNGAGFDMQYADKLFGVFQRLHTETEFEGTGIGLATTRRIINRHGGNIWAESKPDQGAVFFFTVGEAEKNNQPEA